MHARSRRDAPARRRPPTAAFVPAAAAAALFALPAALAAAGEVDLVRAPSLSPDGREVVFSWRGDLWKAPAAGGHAARLTSHPADETRSEWSPDGRTIAFESDRTGSPNVWLMAADGSDVRRLTREDEPLALTGWTHDGAGVTFVSRRESDVYPEPRPFVVAATGGPVRRLHDAFGRDAAISPDGARVAFVRGGSGWTRRGYRGSDNRDLWLQDRASGAFARVTSWRGNDGLPRWAGPDTLVFASDRELDTQNVWTLRAGEPESSARRLTTFVGADVWDLAVSRDGATAVCVVWGRLHRIDLAADRPAAVPVTLTAAEDEGDAVQYREVGDEASEAALSPDGKALAAVAFGDVYVRNVEEKHPTRRVTESYAREREIAWSPDGVRLYFVSDEPGRDVIRSATVKSTRTEIRRAFDEATAPKPPEDATKPPEPPKPPEEPPPAEPAAPEPVVSEAKPEADAPAAGDAPEEPAAQDEPAAGDETKDEAGKPDEKPAKPKSPPRKNPADRWQDAVAFSVETVVEEPTSVRRPTPSPDGKRLAYRVQGDLVLLDLATKERRVLVGGFDPGIDFRWSPDSRWIAYATDDRDFNADVWIVPADGSAPAVNVSRHPANDFAPRWSADGKILAFLSERTDHEIDVWRVLLDRSLEAMTPEEFAKYQKDAAAAAKKRKPLVARETPPAADAARPVAPDAPAEPAVPAKPAEKPSEKPAPPAPLDLDDAWKRLARVTSLRGNETNLEILPGGDGFVFRGKNGDDEGLFACDYDGTKLRRLVAGAAAAQHVTLPGDAVVFVNGGRVATVPPGGGASKPIELKARVALDRDALTVQRFTEAARIVGEHFYDGTMKGRDWPAETARYLELARRTRTGEEFNFVANALLGELNASHLGISMPGTRTRAQEPNGRLGIDTEPADGGFRVTGIVPYGPADRGPMKLAVGDVITSVDGVAVGAADTAESILAGRVGRETLLGVRRAQGGADRDLSLLVTPIAGAAEAALRYDAWTARNEETVHRLSGRRLGYLHIRSMNQPSLEEFERDLYAAAAGHQGLVIDVRNNGGGNTADLVLASIMVQPHAYTVPRGADPEFRSGYPRDRLYIQRFVLPANLLCNEKSFSNAEILSHAFRTLRRGTLVGQETYGGVISTGGETTLDGTFVRTPFRGWFLPDGTGMENHGAVPDLLVPQTPDAEARGEDEQLRAAVEDLLRRL